MKSRAVFVLSYSLAACSGSGSGGGFTDAGHSGKGGEDAGATNPSGGSSGGGSGGQGGSSGSGGSGGIPTGWTCAVDTYADDWCDCGCGALDVDCTSTAIEGCDYCDAPGSCSTAGCPGTIDPDETTHCMSPTVCEPGSCGIELVADLSNSPLSTPQTIVVDATHVYFAHNLSSNIHRAPKSGGAYELVADAGDDVLELAERGDLLYPFLSTGNSVELHELPKAGGASKLIHMAPGSNIDVGSVVPEADAVYFGSGQNAGGGADAYRWDPVSSTKTLLYPAARYLRTTSSHVYWLGSGALARAPKSVGAAFEPIVSTGTDVRVFEIEGNEIVYSYRDRVLLYRVPLVAPYQAVQLNPTEISADFVYGELCIDANNAYVMADQSSISTLYRIPRSGGEAVPFVTDQPNGRGLAQDADYLYWSATYPCGESCSKKLIVRKKK